MNVSDFDFELPEELIAQHPPAERGGSRLVVFEGAGHMLHIEEPEQCARELSAFVAEVGG